MPGGRTSKVTAVPTSIVRVPSSSAVQWNGYVGAVGLDRAEAPRLVERGDRCPSHQWTILASGSSMMSLAPASLSAGISVLIVSLATTVSTA